MREQNRSTFKQKKNELQGRTAEDLGRPYHINPNVNMKLQPVKHYKQPDYPTQDYLLDHPELLRLVPKRWQGNRIVLTVLSATALLISSCHTKATPKVIKAAPIFIHGEGRGGGGGIVGDMSFYLTESQAAQIIQDEAVKMSLAFSCPGNTIEYAKVPYTFDDGRTPQEVIHPDDTSAVTEDELACYRQLALDGYNKKYNVGFEFISREDFDQWLHPQNLTSTASYVDMRTTAERLSKSLPGTKYDICIGIFYDPVTSHDEVVSLYHSEMEQSEDQLRRQVRDFIQWLKSEGII